MQYDIYNVESPFQLLGALEAKKQMSEKDHAANALTMCNYRRTTFCNI